MIITAQTIFLLLAIGRTAARREIVDQFETVRSVTEFGHCQYRLYRPADRSTARRRPLLVWLHGMGEAGQNNQDQLAWLELLFDTASTRPLPAYVLAMQRPASAPGWTVDATPHPLALLDAVIEQVIRRYPIDPQRIYLAGISSGASGCWEFASRYPDRIAAMVPMATTRFEHGRLDGLMPIPIWCFQSTGDGLSTICQIEHLTQRVNQAGGRAHLTIVDQSGHDCWTGAFVDFDVGNWLLAQRRNEPLVPPPGWPLRQYQLALLAAASVLAFVLACGGRWLWRSVRRNAQNNLQKSGFPCRP